MGSRLVNLPPPLRFGTSGRRGAVVHLTQLEVYLNALAELEYLQTLPRVAGGIVRGEEFYFAADLRPSSTGFVPEQAARGELAQAVARAIRDAGLAPVWLGRIPTPALTAYALARGRGSIMVTGSHIPFDRNGYKTNTATGELRKQDETPITRRVDEVRQRVYAQRAAASPFDGKGMLKAGHQELPPARAAAAAEYVARYTRFFADQTLAGRRIVVYQHSAVGRDLLVELLQQFGAEVVAVGRSDTFVPIDTENIDAAQLAQIQALVDAAAAGEPFDAVVSADGDSDRPLVLGVERDVTRGADGAAPSGPAGGRRSLGAERRIEARHVTRGIPGPTVRFFGGDLVGMVVAEFLGTDAVVVPISCNDAIDRGPLARVLEPKTRIGSPYVIAGMDQARARGKRAVCGWEANGGFLLGSDLERAGRVLPALPTRDAVLPILGVLFAAADRGGSVAELFARLPPRFSRAALLKKFPRATAQQIVARFSPGDAAVREVRFGEGGEPAGVASRVSRDSRLGTADATPPNPDGAPVVVGMDGGEQVSPPAVAEQLQSLRAELGRFFPATDGFGSIAFLNYMDGVRIGFANGDVAHVRPSGNADELRIYAVADTQERADAIAARGVAEPDGLLRRMEAAVL